jgi:3-dehydroquinate synthase
MKNNDIIHTRNLIEELNTILTKFSDEKKMIITDENCERDCLPHLHNIIDDTFEIFSMKAGEEYKTIQTVQKIWEILSENEYTRNSLIINLGGGVVSDLGGFAASTFKRGLSYINIPTTVLAQADASVGGKTGFNINSLKNEIGLFNQAKHVLISDIFMKTLTKREFLSGFAEMIKHALIRDNKHLVELTEFLKSYINTGKLRGYDKLIKRSVEIKAEIVHSDPFESGLRKILNFGHTFGHAFESYLKLTKGIDVKHGEAIAAGMICELYLSYKKTGLNIEVVNSVTKQILNFYKKIEINEKEYQEIYELMLHDKKNKRNVINCVLIDNIGHALIDQQINEDGIYEALNYIKYFKSQI